MGGQYVGVSALALLILGLLVNYLGRGLNRESVWTVLTVTAIGTVIYNFLYWLILTTLGNTGTILGLLKFLAFALPTNLLVILIVFFVYTRVYRRRMRPKTYAIVNMRSGVNMRNGVNKRNNKMNLRNMR
jgi:hypothetical protein